MKARVLLDSANLHNGGAVQVAASLTDEWIAMAGETAFTSQHPWLTNLEIHVSSAVARSLKTANCPRISLTVRDRRPLSVREIFRRRKYDVVLTVFGPHYGRLLGKQTIVGYADGTAVNPRPEGTQKPNLRRRLYLWTRSAISRKSLSRHDAVVVETAALQQLLCRHVPKIAKTVHVIPNAYNAIFDDPELWAPPLDSPWSDNRPEIVFSYISRPHAYKNMSFVGKFLEALQTHGIDATCLLTIPPELWKSIDSTTRKHAINLGPVNVTQLPRVYELSDAALFPSLLETFSVMPLEAMRMGLPVIASDRDFVRTTCGDVPFYIDPLDPSAAAERVAQEYLNDTLLERGPAGSSMVTGLPRARDRAVSYARLVDTLIK